MPFGKGGGNMLAFFELFLAIIIVAVRHYLKNKEKYQVKIKRILLKVAATVLARFLPNVAVKPLALAMGI